MIVEFRLTKDRNEVVLRGELDICQRGRQIDDDVATIRYKQVNKDAQIFMHVHENGMDWAFLMPIHDSEDWESIGLNEYSLLFKRQAKTDIS